VEVLLADADVLSAAEYAGYGLDRRCDELPVELRRRKARLAAIGEGPLWRPARREGPRAV
jgi:hypothetical protein